MLSMYAKCLKLKILRVFLAITFLLPQFIVNPGTAIAAPGNDPIEAITVPVGASVSAYIESDEVRWFKVTPSASLLTVKTHLAIETLGNLDTVITVYEDLERALIDESYYDNDDKTTTDLNAFVKMPLAWKGSYYIKVESYDTGPYTLRITSLKEAPIPFPEDDCSAEAVVSGKVGGLRILSDLRTVRDKLLSKTAVGKNLTNLYYRMSPYLVKAVITDKKFRTSLYNDVVKVQPLLQQVAAAADGKQGSYVFTMQDHENLLQIRTLIESRLPSDLKSSLSKLWDGMGVDSIEGKSLNLFLTKGGLLNNKSTAKEYVGNQLVIKLKPELKTAGYRESMGTYSATVNKVLQNYGAKSFVSLGAKGLADGTFLINFDGRKQVDPLSVAGELSKLSDVVYAEPNYIFHALDNDIYYSNQWSLRNITYPGKDINYVGMNQKLQGELLPGTMIAVVDSGVNYRLADLAGITRTDIDIDFANGDNDAMDDHNHGTHVAGIIASGGNNSYSMTGINKRAQILPVKVLDDFGSGDEVNVALGIKYAVARGAKVINLSLGANQVSSIIEEALSYAAGRNVLAVAASGNDGAGQLSYPASSIYTLSVGATDKTDQKAGFSNYGAGLDVVAPGVDINSLILDGNVAYASGTSMATPHVAALAGLVYSEMPQVTWGTARQIIREGTDDLGAPGKDIYYGYGRVDGAKVLDAVGRRIPKGSVKINSGAPYTRSASVTLNIAARGPSTVSPVTQMIISNRSDFYGSSWQPYSTVKSWTLSAGNGTKTVYIRFKDSAGRLSPLCCDTIMLDNRAPYGSININNGASSTSSTGVTLYLSAADLSPGSGVYHMLLSNRSDFYGASWQPYASSKAWTLPSGSGTKNVYVKFKDRAGNISGVYRDSITLN